MDGGRRLLRPVEEVFASLTPAAPLAVATAATSKRGQTRSDARGQALVPASRRLPVAVQRRRVRRGDRLGRIVAFVTRRGFGTMLVLLFTISVGVYGALRGGAYDRFVAENGSLQDAIASTFGFGVHAITISGQRELTAAEILAASGISERNSVLFLNAGQVRDNLKLVPLIEDASVRKLYPDRLLLDIKERGASALWQKDGEVAVIAADGTAIDAVKDDRFAHLPFVVGEGANKRIGEYQKIVDASGDMRSKIRAGVLISQRRWNLKLTSGIDVKLPEEAPEVAVARLASLVHDYRLLDKDIIIIDMRVPGKMVLRLSEEAAAQRAEALAKTTKTKRGPA